jgi:hypothetical protein
MKKLTKTGQVAGVQGFIMAIVGVAVILAVGLIVLSELQTSTTENSTAYNSTGTIITKLATVPTWIGILITVALAFIVLSYFYTRG